jgi:hypothetical protein
MFSDWVSQIAKAEIVIMLTSVTMKAGMLSAATAEPFRSPTSAATSSMARMASGMPPAMPASGPPDSDSTTPQIGAFDSTEGSAAVVMSIAPTTEVSATTEPWLRSMPAMASTKVCPMATTRSGHMFDSTFTTLPGASSVGRKGRAPPRRRATCRG